MVLRLSEGLGRTSQYRLSANFVVDSPKISCESVEVAHYNLNDYNCRLFAFGGVCWIGAHGYLDPEVPQRVRAVNSERRRSVPGEVVLAKLDLAPVRAAEWEVAKALGDALELVPSGVEVHLTCEQAA